MKQLDVDVSPPAFVWNPYLTFTNVTFDLDPRELLAFMCMSVGGNQVAAMYVEHLVSDYKVNSV